REDVPALPDVIPRRQDVDTRIPQLLGGAGVDTLAIGRVFAVGDDEVDVPVAAQARDGRSQRPPAGTPHDIPEEQQAHGQCAISLARVSRMTVTLICPG